MSSYDLKFPVGAIRLVLSDEWREHCLRELDHFGIHPQNVGNELIDLHIEVLGSRGDLSIPVYGSQIEIFRGFHVPWLQGRDQVEILLSDPGLLHVACIPEHRKINLQPLSRDSDWLPWLLRIIREFVIHQAESSGGYFFHGVGLEHKSHGIVLTGCKGTGKTSLALKILEAGIGFRLVTADKGFLGYRGQSDTMVAIPEYVRIHRKKVLSVVPLMDVAARGLHRAVKPNTEKIEFAPKELCEALNIESVPSADFRLLILADCSQESTADPVPSCLQPEELDALDRDNSMERTKFRTHIVRSALGLGPESAPSDDGPRRAARMGIKLRFGHDSDPLKIAKCVQIALEKGDW